MTAAEPIFDAEISPDDSTRVSKGDASAMVVRGNWFYPVILLVPIAVFLAGLWCAQQSPLATLAFAIVGSMTGLAMTLIAMAWGVSIAFTDSTRAGLLFAICPPYMPYFAATRWRWMTQPSALFFAGLTLAAATLWAVKLLTPAP